MCIRDRIMADCYRLPAGRKPIVPAAPRYLLEIDLVPDGVKPRRGALLVLVAAGGAGDADTAEQAAAGFDHQSATEHGDMRQLGKARIQLTGAKRLHQVI